MNREDTYLTLEPYVHVSLNKQGVFLYNTLNKQTLISDSPAVVKFIKKLQQEDNLNVIEFDSSLMEKDSALKKFIEKARQKFMVDLIPGAAASSPAKSSKPVQLPPITGLRKEPAERRDVFSFSKQGILYLNELFIYLTGSCDLGCGICSRAHKQFPCCYRPPGAATELEIDSIKDILRQSRADSLARIHLLGGNILKYSQFPVLIEYLKESDTKKIFYIHYQNLDPEAVDIKMFSHPTIGIHILVPFPAAGENLIKLFTALERNGVEFNTGFIVQSGEELSKAGEIAGEFCLQRFSFSPYFNGSNKTFFKNRVYVRKKALLQTKTSIKEIFSRAVVNRNYFGKLTLTASGQIFADMNKKPLGSMNDSLRRVIYEELQETNSWLLTRDKVKPCRECHFRLLCPSISNYEFALGQNNLCTLWKETSPPRVKKK